MKVQLYADFTCPFSYMGKRIVDEAIAQTEGEVEFEWKAFQLTPDASTEVAIPTVELLAKKFNKTKEEVMATTAQLKARALQLGLEYNYDIMKAPNTMKAHRLTKWAASFNKGQAITEAFFHALFTNGANLNKDEELLQIVASVGLDQEEARTVLESDAYANEVNADKQEAIAKGIQSVPTMIVNNQFIIQGVQPVEMVVQAFRRQRPNGNMF